MDGTASRTAAFPGEQVSFEARPSPQAGLEPADVEWSGGGEPRSGRGLTFVTRFVSGGEHKVGARLGTDAWDVTVSVWPLEQLLAEAGDFYGPSLDLSRVRVRTSRLVAGGAGMAWTCNDVVRFKRPRRPQDLPDPSTLIHELGHVWEHQNGQAQLLGGLVEQVCTLFGRDPYDYGGPDGARRAGSLEPLSKESQAQIIQECWKSQHGYAADARGVPFSAPGYVEDLRRLVEGAGIGTRAPAGPRVAGRLDSWVAALVNAVLSPLD